MGTVLQDLRYAARILLKNPGFAAVAILALALGIGANTAIFSIVNAVLLRPLPYTRPDRLVVLWETSRKEKKDRNLVSYLNYSDWRQQNTVFEQLAAYGYWVFNLTGVDEPERLRGVLCSANLFEALGVRPVIGPGFSADADQPGKDQVVILSHHLWQRRFHSDPGVVGRQVRLNGRGYAVVGVAPADFNFPAEDADVWAPLSLATVALRFPKLMQDRSLHFLTGLGRLKPNATIADARAEMNIIASRLEAQYPDSNAGYGVNVITLDEQLVGDVRPTLLVLFGAVAFVLLIACANVANLLLARAVSRSREIALRAALGASRLRITRQLLTESVLLSLLGAVIGVLLALIVTRVFVALAPADIPRLKDARVDLVVLGFSLAIAVLTGVLFGLAPALQLASSDLQESLKEGGRGTTAGGRQHRVRSYLIIGEVALSLVLLIGAGLSIKSMLSLRQVDPGFDPHNVLTMRMLLPNDRYGRTDQQTRFATDLEERLRAIPGVQAAAISGTIPMTSLGQSTLNFRVGGRPVMNTSELPLAISNVVTPDYFRVMTIPLRQGRLFTSHDTSDGPSVAVVSQEVARRLFPGEDPLGKRIQTQDAKEGQWLTIVGVVGDVKYTGLGSNTGMQIYVPYAQKPQTTLFVEVRSQTDPNGLLNSVRGAIANIDREQPVFTVKTMDEIVNESISQPRLLTLILAIFAFSALLLASVGIYGVMAYSVRQRTHEIGIRMALGAQGSDVMMLVLKQGMFLVVTGVVIGAVAAFFLTRVLSGLLFGVAATDPWTFAALSVFLVVVGAVAILIPSRRATTIDPMVALRQD